MKFDSELKYQEIKRDNWKYFGQVDSEGKACGIGRRVFTDDGETQEGEWRDNEMNGFGRNCYRKDFITAVYTGFFEKHKRNGQGILRFDDGSTKKGIWKDDVLVTAQEVSFE